jgi:hypothetical protein
MWPGFVPPGEREDAMLEMTISRAKAGTGWQVAVLLLVLTAVALIGLSLLPAASPRTAPAPPARSFAPAPPARSFAPASPAPAGQAVNYRELREDRFMR